MAMPTNPIWALMNQAQAIEEPNMSMAPTDQQMMASQQTAPPGMTLADISEDEAQQLMSQGVPVMPAGPSASSIKRTESVRMRGPMSQEAVPQDLIMSDMANQYDLKLKEAMAQQQQGVGQLEENVNQMRQAPTGVDWTSLAAYMDSVNPGSNLLEAAKGMRPETPVQRAEKLLSLQNMLQERKGDITKNQLAALKEQLDARKAMQVNPLDIELKNARIDAYRALAGQKEAGKILPETSIQKFSDFDASLKELGDMAENIDQYKGSMGPVKGRISSMNPYDTPAQSFQADLDRARQVIGKAVEGGVLRKEDEAKYEKMLPALKDAPAVAKYKMQQFANKMSIARNTYLRNLKAGGYDTKNLGIGEETPGANQKHKVGEVKNGYRFKGGNWKDESSWEPVK